MLEFICLMLSAQQVTGKVKEAGHQSGREQTVTVPSLFSPRAELGQDSADGKCEKTCPV